MEKKKEVMISSENHKKMKILRDENDLRDFDAVITLLLKNYKKSGGKV